MDRVCSVCQNEEYFEVQIPYVDFDTNDAIIDYGSFQVDLCSGCWQLVCSTLRFPFWVSTLDRSLEDEIEDLLLSIRADENFPLKADPMPLFQERRDPATCLNCHAAHPVRTRCLPMDYRPRQKDLRKGEKRAYGQITLSLCEDCWESLVCSSDDVVLSGWDWWDAVDGLDMIIPRSPLDTTFFEPVN